MKHGSDTQRELLKLYRGFQPTAEYNTYLTTLDIESMNLTDSQFDALINKPSEILIENGMNEWNLYKYLPEIYKHDKEYANVFSLIRKNIDSGNLTWAHAGGCSLFVAYVKKAEDTTYHGMYRYKVFINFDRDTNNDTSFDGNKNALFKFLCDKDYTTIKDSDIYTLSFKKYVWHSWYKRAIENYFPNRLYVEAGVDISQLPSGQHERDYYKFSMKGYSKDMISDFPSKVSKSDFEDTTKHFNINGKQISEMRLLLLKIAKII